MMSTKKMTRAGLWYRDAGRAESVNLGPFPVRSSAPLKRSAKCAWCSSCAISDDRTGSIAMTDHPYRPTRRRRPQSKRRAQPSRSRALVALNDRRRAAGQPSLQAAWNRRRVLAGKCARCGRRRDRGGTSIHCAACRDAYNAWRRDWSSRRHEAGLCVRCGGPNDDLEFVRCTTCRERERERRHAMVARRWERHSPRRRGR
jgi:hypothetical protein